MSWWVIVPMKSIDRAKSRIDVDPRQRRALAVAMARDTLRAAAKAVGVTGVVLVCERHEDLEALHIPDVRVEVRPGLGLNEAVKEGAALLSSQDRDRGVAALPADLPFLRSDELTFALRRAARVPAGVVADREGTGTTLLTARSVDELRPAFGEDSLARHRASGARPLRVPRWSGLRHDVDRMDDLASRQGLGPHTHRLLREQRFESSGRLADA